MLARRNINSIESIIPKKNKTLLVQKEIIYLINDEVNKHHEVLEKRSRLD